MLTQKNLETRPQHREKLGIDLHCAVTYCLTIMI